MIGLELTAKNVIIGGIIIIINLIPLLTKKYKLLTLTSAISLFIALLGIFL
jgi:hypothetical protein